MLRALPLFHLYGEPLDDQAFDFIHVETIASRSSIHGWRIRSHRHPNLFQILFIECGGGDMDFQATRLKFSAPVAILVPATVAHGFRFEPNVTDGWVLTFTEDAALGFAQGAREALSRLRVLAEQPVISICDETERARLSALFADLSEEQSLMRESGGLAMHGLLALIGVSVVRLAASRAGTGSATLLPADITVTKLRALVYEHFCNERSISFYAEKLSMTRDRLNDHAKRATGISAGHLIRQHVLAEAKRQLAFGTEAIHHIAENLAFADASHFARFFRKHSGTTPQEFRERHGRKATRAREILCRFVETQTLDRRSS